MPVIITGPSRAAGGTELRYLHRDRLGSVVTSSDEAGEVALAPGEARHFDPFGKPQEGDLQDSDDPLKDLNAESVTSRGFTAHEHLNSVQLIHMNGRAYDYQLGRFLSVDPFIQFPANGQSLNPYSYLMNNPLAGTDPSGYLTNCDTLVVCSPDEWSEWLSSWEYFIQDALNNPAEYNGADSNAKAGASNQSNTRPEDVGNNQKDGTYFFGGAGIDGDYIGDMVTALQEAGISDVHAVNGPRWSMNDGEFPLLGMGLDAFIGVLALNEEIDLGDRINTTPERLINKGDGKGQFNLVGYSYGSLVAAQVAMTRVKKGGTVDNLVLIGSPIDSGFLKTLRSSPGIKNVMVKDLVQHGDTIKAGMSGASLFNPFVFVPLAKQFASKTGHFHYAPMSQVGNSRRRDLAKELYGAGLR